MSSPPPPPVPDKTNSNYSPPSTLSPLNITTTIGSLISNSLGKMTVMTSTTASPSFGTASPLTHFSHPLTPTPQQYSGATGSRRTSTASVISAQSARQEDHLRERKALFGAFRLSIKSLMDTHAGTGIAVEDEDEHLERFCTIVEHLLRHGFKSKVRGVETVSDAALGFFKAAAWSALGGRRDVWDFVKGSMKAVQPTTTPSVLRTIIAMETLKKNVSRLR